ncbi:MAG: ATP phosphoribosyltransferase regulatory subunit [Leptospirales bacterium]|jgi:ATP phosphoribosyltransferase regulatory subunit HisZ
MLSQRERFRSWIPHGFDFLNPAETRIQLDLKEKVRAKFQAAGYLEIVPPMFDFARTFSLTARGAAQSPVFQVRAGEGELLAVRSDLTVQVVKAVANRRLKQEFPARYSYIQPVFQDRPWGSGSSREILQAGVELVGEGSPDRFDEILNLARECLAACGGSPRILYGDVRFLEYLFQMIPERARPDLSLAFHNKDTGRIRRISEEAGLSADLIRVLTEVPLTFGGPEAMDRLKEICAGQPRLMDILNEAARRRDVIFDFSLVRELSYYTGPVFEAYIADSNETVFTGGVYDDLYAEFTGDQRPACGFALNLSTLVEQRAAD